MVLVDKYKGGTKKTLSRGFYAVRGYFVPHGRRSWLRPPSVLNDVRMRCRRHWCMLPVIVAGCRPPNLSRARIGLLINSKESLERLFFFWILIKFWFLAFQLVCWMGKIIFFCFQCGEIGRAAARSPPAMMSAAWLPSALNDIRMRCRPDCAPMIRAVSSVWCPYVLPSPLVYVGCHRYGMPSPPPGTRRRIGRIWSPSVLYNTAVPYPPEGRTITPAGSFY